MPTRQLTVITFILLSLLLPLHTNAQTPTPGSSPAKTTKQSLAADPAPLQKGRDTFTIRYVPLFYLGTRQPRPAMIGSFPNHKQARFLIDTGTDGTIIGENLARSLSLNSVVVHDSSTAARVDGKALRRVVMPNCVVDALPFFSPVSGDTVGKAYAFGGVARVLPQKHAIFFGADGAFGTNILLQAAALFDGPKQEVTFIMGGNLSAREREQIGFLAATPLPVLAPPSADSSSLLTVAVTLENDGISRQVVLLVDTGADRTSIPRETALALRLQPTVYSSILQGFAGTERIDTAPVGTIKIGNLVLHNIPVNYPSKDKEAPAALGPKGSVVDTLGMDILGDCRVLIDLPGHMMYLSAGQSDPHTGVK